LKQQEKNQYAGLTYEQCLRTFADMVTRACIIHCDNEEDAKDCFQNVFIKLYTSEKTFETEQHLKAWLLRVTMNECIDCARQSWKKKMTLSEDVSAYEKEETYMENESTQTDSVVEELQKLPYKYRQVVYLYYYEERTVKEIADFLDLPEGTVKTRLSRGRKKLEQRLRKEKNEQVIQEFHIVS